MSMLSRILQMVSEPRKYDKLESKISNLCMTFEVWMDLNEIEVMGVLLGGFGSVLMCYFVENDIEIKSPKFCP
jgi:hypothetical protein